MHVSLLFLAIDDCKSASGGVVQSYEDLVRNYVVSHGVFHHNSVAMHVCSVLVSEL